MSADEPRMWRSQLDANNCVEMALSHEHAPDGRCVAVRVIKIHMPFVPYVAEIPCPDCCVTIRSRAPIKRPGPYEVTCPRCGSQGMYVVTVEAMMVTS